MQNSKQESKKKKFRLFKKIGATALLAALRFLDKKFIDKIPNTDIQNMARLLLMPFVGTIKALSDGNPRNAEQISAIWRKWTNSELYEYSIATSNKYLERIPDEHLREAISHLSLPLLGMIQIFTDDDPNNNAQLKSSWSEFIKDGKTHKVVLQHLLIPMLEAAIKDPDTEELIISLIKTALENSTGILPISYAAYLPETPNSFIDEVVIDPDDLA